MTMFTVLVDQAHSSAWSIDPELAERMNPANPGDASLARAAAVLRERGRLLTELVPVSNARQPIEPLRETGRIAAEVRQRLGL